MGKGASLATFVGTVIVVVLIGVFAWKPISQNLNLGLDLQGGLHVVLQADESSGAEVTDDTITKSIGIIRERVDRLGVSEPTIYAQGADRIVVEIAGVDDPEEAVNIIRNTAQLEFWDEEGNVLLTGEHLKDAQAAMRSGANDAIINLEFDEEGALLFEQATQDNVGKALLIVLDDEIISAPIVNEVIEGGQCIIEGSFSAEEANNLAMLLRSGALPVSFQILEKRTVGPTLGADSLEKSLQASAIGLLLILAFMIFYYRLPGIVADISLILYSLVVLGCMILLGSVLTLPGIAGFALSVGMAVDANVIIYERLKEELRSGKSLRASVEASFKHASWTIFDANLTTLITAIVLMYFGSGPIRGFAVTLSIGIVASVLIALTFTRFLLNLMARVSSNTKLFGA